MSIEPVVVDVRVPADAQSAFNRFTEELDSWWPRRSHSVSQEACASVAIEGYVGGRIFETTKDGVEHEWGRLRSWEPGRSFSTSWHPGRDAAEAQVVEVDFLPQDDGTLVRLTHRLWEPIGEGAADTRDRYASGWPGVMDAYRDSLGGND